MIEKITLKIFLTAMLLCASSALLMIWFHELVPEKLELILPTFFIIGLASFFTWSPIIVYRFLENTSV
ncbi:MAG: hypothetical protein WD509_02425 [Candidatus Paceibacterota bacterium]